MCTALVPMPVATTAGSSYSRETIAACDMMPPPSDTAAAMRANTIDQLGCRQRADEDLAVDERRELIDVVHDAGDALGHARRGGEALELVAACRPRSRPRATG